MGVIPPGGLLSRRESAVTEVGIGTSIQEKMGEPVPGVTVERWGVAGGMEGAEVGGSKAEAKQGGREQPEVRGGDREKGERREEKAPNDQNRKSNLNQKTKGRQTATYET